MSRNKKIETSIFKLGFLLEALELYIRHAGHYSDWASKEQFYRRSIRDNTSKQDLDYDESHFFSHLHIYHLWITDDDNWKSVQKETQREFYKWIGFTGITAKNCPERLKHHLNQINEIISGRGGKFSRAYKESKKEWKKEFKHESPVFWQAEREVRRFFFGDALPSEPITIYDVKIKGNAEQGQKTFEEIKNSITNQPEWTFPWQVKFTKKLKEKIKELEGKGQPLPKEKPEPKNSSHREMNLDTIEDTLRTVELYIQKLNLYPDWKISEWVEKCEDWRKNWENKNTEEIKGLLGVDLKALSLMLRQFKENDPDYFPHLISELKIKLSQWQSERKINPIDCPAQLKQVFQEIDEVLESRQKDNRKNKGNDKDENSENEKDKIVKIIVKLKLEITEFNKKYKIKITELDPQFNNWEKRLMDSENVSEAKEFQRKIEQKIHEEEAKHQLPAANENKLPLPAKIALGAGIVGLLLGIIVIFQQVVKKRKIKK